MLFITDNLLAKASETIKKCNLGDIFNQKKYTIADTPLSYRQANTLDKDKLLNDNRTGGKGWRKFSFKELVYIDIVLDLKKFGVKHEQLKQLWQSFFKEPDGLLVPSLVPNRGESEIAISSVFGGVEMVLCIDSDGEILYFDPQFSTKYSQSSKPLIRVSLNVVINKIIKLIIKEELPVEDSIKKLIVEYKLIEK
ncbi:MAG: hypothetical protein WC841_03170 [Candidatus Shapirobacteria bacterium]|jgi:hypothetical protein